MKQTQTQTLTKADRYRNWMMAPKTIILGVRERAPDDTTHS